MTNREDARRFIGPALSAIVTLAPGARAAATIGGLLADVVARAGEEEGTPLNDLESVRRWWLLAEAEVELLNEKIQQLEADNRDLRRRLDESR